MKKYLLCLTAVLLPAVAAPASAQTYSDQRRWEAAQERYEQETEIYERERRRYMASRERRRGSYRGGYDDPYATDYDAARYYRDDPRYSERRLSAQDEVYRGSDGRYYCKRSDGTTGLIIGGVGGALLGNVIDGGRSRGAGTLIGVAVGALIGREVERSREIRCR